MPVLVTGSVAIDHIMVFDDSFKNHILPDKVHMLNVSFLVPDMKKQWGGTGANIAYNLRVLEEDPILLATVGSDLGAYGAWMDQHGIKRDWLLTLEDAFTAQCFITTDLDNNQITSFHPGAMDRAHEAQVEGVADEYAAGIVAPNGKQAMQEYARALKASGVPCIVDPGQGLPMFDRDELIELIDGAAVYVVNDYEWALTQEKTSLGEDALAERVGALIITRGAEGSILHRGALDLGVTVEEQRSVVPVVTAEDPVDPTGCGDAYRAGLLYAIANGLTLEVGARMGSLMGSLKVERAGPQSIEPGLAAFRDRYQNEFGSAF